MTMPGTALVLNGTSGAGKSTLARREAGRGHRTLGRAAAQLASGTPPRAPDRIRGGAG